MKTIDIKGKPYVPVHERIIFFRENELYTNWSIETEILEFGDIVLMKAVIKDENGRIRATGHSYEKENSTFINKTSYIENCETSAVGRTLGMLGIGVENSFASAEEVGNAVKNQDKEADTRPWMSLKQKEQILQRIREDDLGACKNGKEFFEKIDSAFKMKREYREEINQEINSDFLK